MENTSYIAEISYEIEKWLHKGYSIDKIKQNIIDLQKKDKFPSNLEFVDAYFDKAFGASGCAFLDKNTGETIVGFAGTNKRNGVIEFLKDGVADVIGLGFTGIHKDSLYLMKSNKFMDSLIDKGYNITQTTGHSLGGALSGYMGIYYDIPLIATYNGAPLYVLPTTYLVLNGFSIDDAAKNYNGKFIRFVSDKDWLNGFADSMSGFYVGEEFLFRNGNGHDLKFFMNEEEQKYISQIISSYRNNKDETVSIDFDGDGKADLILNKDNLIIKNLFDEKGLYSGNGVNIQIDPEAFYYLSQNLESNMANDDIEWINYAITLCNEKNESIKNDISYRDDVLCEKIVEGLNNASLTKLVSVIDESHGELIKENNKGALKELSEFDTYDITRNFDMWGSSSGRVWFLDGVQFNQNDLINWVKGLKSASYALYNAITTTGEYTYYTSSLVEKQTYKFDTLSDISDSFVNVTNRFLGKTEEVFKGIGLRSGKNDGIVNAITEVLEVETENIAQIKEKIISVANMAKGLADNFSDMDTWLSKDIKEGKTSGKYESIIIPTTYESFLKESEIFDDVKDVIEAYDLQVEEAALKLSQTLVNDFSDLISRTQSKINAIYSAVENFKESINNLVLIMNKVVTSKYKKQIMTSDYEYVIEEITDNHGILSNFFTSNVVNSIAISQNNIIIHIESLYNAIYIIELYNSEIYNLTEYFRSIVEESVYDSMELDSIIQSQNLVYLRIERMIKELEKVHESIQLQYKGDSLVSYQEQLKGTITSLSYINLMITDCFGRNLE